MINISTGQGPGGNKNPIPLIVIVGPTAVGKTECGVLLAKTINGEIVSADSMQIYRYMDIGTAKPTIEEMCGIPHYMLDIINPDEEYSVALYQEAAENYIRDIFNRGSSPILVGGTGLYVRSITDHYNFSRAEINWEYRAKLNQSADLRGNEYIHNLLKTVDPLAAEKIHCNDRKRIIRALEVFDQTGRPISSYHDRDTFTKPKYKLHIFGLIMERSQLYRRIEIRIDKMMEQGFLKEVRGLLDRGYSSQLTSMKSLGYKELGAYLNGNMSLEEAVEMLKRNTRRFAKRQLTWFKRDNKITWLDISRQPAMDDIVQEIIKIVAGVSC
ncbi:tRNA delta(2)-isopentenylpyrophosphate transferase [Desulfofarcimen acetoxidans DSM 771]|uniref:tRNA dimethylallyltransferase n=1 Tax=Desulfofarcimen acetoxidans (strain ATCC 49208 / DSM 771 / KCTC 5769 / VKM B-1644 / 5575) TaxID=485916 RepID=C8VZ48_DESAS|nr:tRNA (adenosine(37)-N6)-dimethylallyltransferase MiaA [Desulfofarcimen acetoxidans]ACV62958.1 tRNA delta(2)-isopentenylpyrophosphate transferase [Desulfofarcimen acetoxidans DSM 771]